MAPLRSRGRRRDETNAGLIGGDSWASYSDLIAGVLLIFIFVTVLKDVQLQQIVAEPADILEGWQKALNELCQDEELRAVKELTTDCNTGVIALPNKVLFEFNRTELRDEGKQLLVRVVPTVLKKLREQPVIWERVNVEVRGHADPRVDSMRDPYEVNLEKSTKRAENVLLFLTTDDAFTERDRRDLKALAVSSGAAHMQRPTGCETLDTAACYDRMRRVEIRLMMDDLEIRRELIKLLDQLRGIDKESNDDDRLG